MPIAVSSELLDEWHLCIPCRRFLKHGRLCLDPHEFSHSSHRQEASFLTADQVRTYLTIGLQQVRSLHLPCDMLDVLTLTATGRSIGEMAEQLGITRNEVVCHLSRAMFMFSATSKLEAVLASIRLGLIDTPTRISPV